MRWIAALLVTLALAHHAYKDLALLYPDVVFAEKAIFYAAGGFERVVLYFIIGLLGARVVKPHERLPLLLACLWGLLEGAQIGVCRIGWGIQRAAPSDRVEGLCDALTGVPLYWLGAAALGALALFTLDQIGRSKP